MNAIPFFELRRAHHAHGKEFCRVYQRHIHLGFLILWLA